MRGQNLSEFGTIRWSAWPVYVAALAAQFAFDFGNALLNATANRVPFAKVTSAMRLIYLVDDNGALQQPVSVSTSHNSGQEKTGAPGSSLDMALWVKQILARRRPVLIAELRVRRAGCRVLQRSTATGDARRPRTPRFELRAKGQRK